VDGKRTEKGTGPFHAAAVAAGKAERKRDHGQYFTMASPFDHDAFHAWLDAVPDDAVFIEPFAGANNLVRMVDEAAVPRILTWYSYDIEPRDPAVLERDTLSDFPRHRAPVAVVTNPPYLARNVARRRGLDDVADRCGTWDNLYQACVANCLDNAGHVAAIIPESFLNAGVLTGRLEAVVVMTEPLFADTDVPVCLALWGPEPCGDFIVYAGARRVGSHHELAAHWATETSDPGERVRFNAVDGTIGLVAIDAPGGPTIRFTSASEIRPEEIKVSSRHRTRVSVADLDPGSTGDVIERANQLLAERRDATGDVGLTSFMGLRIDGRYRRRLDFASARTIVARAVAEVEAERRPAGGGGDTDR
jgi:hypothetical protein